MRSLGVMGEAEGFGELLWNFKQVNMIRYVSQKNHLDYSVENGFDLQTRLEAETLLGGY